MTRKKVTIKRLDNMKARQAKYSKRKKGIIKKAKEISVLCDVDLALVMFSPSGKPSLYVGQDKDLHSVVERLSRMSVEDREERVGHTTKLLKKLYTNTDVDPRNFSLVKSDFLKLQQDRLRDLKQKFAQKTKILNEWKNPHTVNDRAKIQTMQDHLVASLNKIKDRKRELVFKGQQKHNVQASQP